VLVSGTVAKAERPTKCIELLSNLGYNQGQTVILCQADAENALEVLELLTHIRRQTLGVPVAVFTRLTDATFISLLLDHGATIIVRLPSESIHSSLQIKSALVQLSCGSSLRTVSTEESPAVPEATPATTEELALAENKQLLAIGARAMKVLVGRVAGAVKSRVFHLGRPCDRDNHGIDTPAATGPTRSLCRQDSAMRRKERNGSSESKAATSISDLREDSASAARYNLVERAPKASSINRVNRDTMLASVASR